MSSPADRLILVTGVPRGGTTAVGRALAFARGSCSLHEPLNAQVGLRRVERFFELVDVPYGAPPKLSLLLNDIVRLRLEYKPGVFAADSGLRRMAKYLVGGRAVNSYRRCRLYPGLRRIIWKDPFAAFIAGTVARDQGVPVVVCVRNPWAVASSFKRMGWGRGDLLPRLVADLGAEDRVARLCPGGLPQQGDMVGNGSLLWYLLYEYLLAEQAKGADIAFVNIDDVVAGPLEIYHKLYGRLDLPWDAGVERRIVRMYKSDANNALPRDGKAHDSRRDLRSVNEYWRKLLTPEEAMQVERLSNGLWPRLRNACS